MKNDREFAYWWYSRLKLDSNKNYVFITNSSLIFAIFVGMNLPYSRFIESNNPLFLLFAITTSMIAVFWLDFLIKIVEIGKQVEIDKDYMSQLMAICFSVEIEEETKFYILKAIINNPEFENQDQKIILNEINDFDDLSWKGELLDLYWNKVNSKEKFLAKTSKSKIKVKSDLDILNSDDESPENIEIASERILKEKFISKETLKIILDKNQNNYEIVQNALKRLHNLMNQGKLTN